MSARSIALATLLLTLSAAAERPEPVTLTLESKFLGERRKVLVSMPRSYQQGDDRYPVLVLTDADIHLEHTIASADALAGVLRMPELIIVGVPSRDRHRDLTPGGGHAFGSFIAAELIPEVDRRYRTHPYRILAGHSLGGLFTLDVLFSRPAAFDAWIVVSPGAAQPEESIIQRAATWSKPFEKTERLFLMVADEDARIVSEVRRLEEVLVARKIANLELVRRDLPDDDHLTSPLSGFYSGLRLLFRPWFFKIDDTDDPKMLYQRAKDHYRRVAERYGFAVPIPAFRFERIARRLLDTGNVDEALGVLTDFTAAHPDSRAARRLLEDARNRATRP